MQLASFAISALLAGCCSLLLALTQQQPDSNAGNPDVAKHAVYPPDDSWSEVIDDAVFAHGRLWLLSRERSFTFLAEGSTNREHAGIDGEILAIARKGRDVIVATCAEPRCQRWVVLRFDGSIWQPDAVVPSNGDAFVAMSSNDAETFLLTSCRVVIVSGAGQRSVEIVLPRTGATPARPDHYDVRPKILPSGNDLYLGYDQGEWGGGLERIDLKSGRLEVIQDKSFGGPHCMRPLDPDCDPVTDLAAAPWNPACIVATIAQAYSGGRVLEICGDKVRRLYFARNRFARDEQPGPDGEIDFGTVGFSGVLALASTITAIGDEAIYVIDQSGAATELPFADFELVDGVYTDFSQQGFVMALHVYSTAWDEDRRKFLGPYVIIAPR